MRDIRIAKLVTGETVVGSYYDDNKEFLADVHVLTIDHTFVTYQQGVHITPYMTPFSVDNGATIDVKHILCENTCPEEIRKEYIKITSVTI